MRVKAWNKRSAEPPIDLNAPGYHENARLLSRTRRLLIDRLVDIRRSRGLSQAQVAEAIGIHRSGVCKFEANSATANPTLEVLLRYAHAVGASIDLDVRRFEETTTAWTSTSHLTMRFETDPGTPSAGPANVLIGSLRILESRQEYPAFTRWQNEDEPATL